MKTKHTIMSLSTALICLTLFSSALQANTLLQWNVRNIGKEKDLSRVAYGNGLYIAIGSEGWDGIMMQSQNGATWSAVTPFTDKTPNTIAFGNNAFLATFAQGEMWRSTDGLTWTDASQPETPSVLRFLENRFFGIISEGGVMHSKDGLSWTKLNNQHLGMVCRDIAVNSNLYVMAGQKGDGSVFITRTTNAGNTWNDVESDIKNHIRSLAYGNNTFVAVGGDGAQRGIIMTSPDGLAWNVITETNNYTLYKVIYEAGMFVVAGDAGTILLSLDGADWTPQNTGSGRGIFDICYAADNTFLGVGLRGTVIQSAPVNPSRSNTVMRDYDGDGMADIAVFHHKTATWYILQSSDLQTNAVQWGWNGTTPVQGDFDGDGKADIAVFDPVSAVWYVLQSSDLQMNVVQWGWSGAMPLTGDFDGDGKTDFATYDPASGTWYIMQSSDLQMNVVQWGWSDTIPMTGDFDCDGKTDFAAYHPGPAHWYIMQSSDLQMMDGEPIQFGWNSATPVQPADYDGDGKADIVVWDSTTGNWYIRQSSDSQLMNGGPIQWGWQAAPPMP